MGYKKYIVSLVLGGSLVLAGCSTSGGTVENELGENTEQVSSEDVSQNIEETKSKANKTETLEEVNKDDKDDKDDSGNGTKEDSEESKDKITKDKKGLDTISQLIEDAVIQSEKYGTDMSELSIEEDLRVEITVQNEDKETELDFSREGVISQTETDDIEDLEDTFEYSSIYSASEVLGLVYEQLGGGTFESLELDKDDGIVKYEIELSTGDVEVNASTGEIKELDKED